MKIKQSKINSTDWIESVPQYGDIVRIEFSHISISRPEIGIYKGGFDGREIIQTATRRILVPFPHTFYVYKQIHKNVW